MTSDIWFLLWSIWFCREVFVFAVRFLFLPWGFRFCREVFVFAVRYFVFAVRFLVLPNRGDRWISRYSYRIYSINRPGRLLNFWTLRVGAYLRWALIRGWAVIKFSPFSAVSVVFLFCKKTVNTSNKTWRSNKARFSRYSEEHPVFGEVSY